MLVVLACGLLLLLNGVADAGEWLEPRAEFSTRTERAFARYTNELDSAETEVFLEMVSNEHGGADKATAEAVVSPRIVAKALQLQTDNMRRQGLSDRVIGLYHEIVRQGSNFMHMRYPETWREQTLWEQGMRNMYAAFDRLTFNEREAFRWQHPKWFALLSKRKRVPLFRARRQRTFRPVLH